jgi:hypothetical protein
MKSSKFAKFHSRGAREEFSWKNPLLNKLKYFLPIVNAFVDVSGKISPIERRFGGIKIQEFNKCYVACIVFTYLLVRLIVKKLSSLNLVCYGQPSLKNKNSKYQGILSSPRCLG